MKYFPNSTSRTLSTLALSIGLVGSALGTTFTPNYTPDEDAPKAGFFDETASAPTASNPGQTLGEKRRYVLEHGVKLLERVVWVPNGVDFPLEVRMRDLGAYFVGRGGGISLFNFKGSDYGLRDDVDYSIPVLAVLTEGVSWTGYEDWERGSFGRITLTDASRFTLNTDFTEGDRFSYLPTILHEGLHILGMTSNRGTIGKAIGNHTKQQSLYDVSVRHLGAEVEMLSEMTVEQQVAVKFGGDDVVWVGESARAHAPLIMRAGFDSMSNPNLYALNEGDTGFISSAVSHIAMQNNPDYDEGLMAPASGNTLELGIVAYMFSDMGYGPVVDSSVTSPDINMNSLSIDTQAAVSDLVDIANDSVQQVVVTVKLPEGLNFGAFTDKPADCVVDDLDSLKAVCTYNDLLINMPSMIDVGLEGEDGEYSIELDVEHQARHVDGVPANNFFTANVLMGSNPLSNLELALSAIEANIGSNEVIGSLSVQNTSNDDVIYSLVSDGEDNSIFAINDSNIIAPEGLTAVDNGSYSLIVKVQTDSGYELENTFTLDISINPMTNVSISGATVSSDKSAGDTVGILATDHALGEEVTFTLVAADIENAVKIQGDRVVLLQSLTRSDNGTYNITVSASDGSYSVENTVSVTVDIPEQPVVNPPTPPASSGGGGCTVGPVGYSDSTFPMIILGLALMAIRRRITAL